MLDSREDPLMQDLEEDTGLRLCVVHDDPAGDDTKGQEVITAAAWDCNSDVPEIGICRKGGCFSMHHINDATSPDKRWEHSGKTYAVFFASYAVPVPRDAGNDFLPVSSPRRLNQDWISICFIPHKPGCLAFIPRHTNKIMMVDILSSALAPPSSLLSFSMKTSKSNDDITTNNIINGTNKASGLACLNGHVVVPVGQHMDQIRCMCVDNKGKLLISGDEGGAVCCLLLSRNPTTELPADDKDDQAASSMPIGDSSYCCNTKAHDGPIFAVASVSTADIENNDTSDFFVTGGYDGNVRIWMVKPSVQRELDGQEVEKLTIHAHRQMLIVGMQITSIAVMSSHNKLMVGTYEGCLFGFQLDMARIMDNAKKSKSTNKDGAGDGNGQEALWLQQTSFSNGQHHHGAETNGGDDGNHHDDDNKQIHHQLEFRIMGVGLPVACIACSATQQLFIATSADGIVSMYRPPLAREGFGLNQYLHHHDHLGNDVESLSWRMVAQCQLGSHPVALCFSPPLLLTEDDDANFSKAKLASRLLQQETLLAIGSTGLIRCWPTLSLPIESASALATGRKPPPPPPPPLPPPSQRPGAPTVPSSRPVLSLLFEANGSTAHKNDLYRNGNQLSGGGGGGGVSSGDGRVGKMDRANNEVCHGRDVSNSRGKRGGYNVRQGRQHDEEEEEVEEDLAPAAPPRPEPMPRKKRTVGFSSDPPSVHMIPQPTADENKNVAQRHDQQQQQQRLRRRQQQRQSPPRQRTVEGLDRIDEEKTDVDGDIGSVDDRNDYVENGGRTVTPSSLNRRPRRLRQTWGKTSSSSSADHLHRRHGDGSDGGLGNNVPFVSSHLKQPSLLSSYALETATAQRMNETFDTATVSATLGNTSGGGDGDSRDDATAEALHWANAAAATSAVTTGPHERKFTGLVDINVKDEEVPDKPRRVKKQVESAYAAKKKALKMTDDELRVGIPGGVEPVYKSDPVKFVTVGVEELGLNDASNAMMMMAAGTRSEGRKDGDGSGGGGDGDGDGGGGGYGGGCVVEDYEAAERMMMMDGAWTANMMKWGLE